jgi:acyl carrier protein
MACRNGCGGVGGNHTMIEIPHVRLKGTVMSDQVRELVLTSLKEMSYDVSDIDGDMPLGPSGIDLESLTIAELAVRVEDALGVKFYEDEMERVVTMTFDEFVAEISARSTVTHAK